ncbi:MAG: PD40 domain-containing protein [Gemmatimonadota bacterium]|nr:MAG: PD40 domain-containing protein [Gemmatimonadota bacterium]
MIEFRLLGSVDLKGPEGTLRSVLAQPKRVALLAYLAVASPRGFHRRDKLLGLFWPESDQEHGRAALRKALYFLRQSLGEEVIVSRGDEEVGLAEDVLSCDAPAFEQALDVGDLEAALELYRGDLLEGFFISEAPEFERWLDKERQRLRERYVGALESLAEKAEAAGDHRSAVTCWKRLRALDLYNSRYVLRLMEALAAAGDRGNALQLAQEHERRLREDLEIEPVDEIRALIERLKREPMPFARSPRTGPEKRPCDRRDQLGVTPESPVPSPGHRVGWGLKVVLVAVPVLAAAAIGIWQLSARSASRAPTLGSSDTRSEMRVHQLTTTGDALDPALSPDGRRVAYGRQEEGGGVRIVVRDLDGQPVERTVAIAEELAVRPYMPSSLGWLPDGSAVTFRGVFRGEFGSFIVPSQGGTVRRAPCFGLPSSVSPDLSEVACCGGALKNLRIYATNPETLGQTGHVDTVRVTGFHEFLNEAVWSSRGDYLAVVAASGTGEHSIEAVARDGSGQRQLVVEGVRISGVDWTGDGRFLYYTRDLPTGPQLMRVALSAPAQSQSRPVVVLQLGDSLEVSDVSTDAEKLAATRVSRSSSIVRLKPDANGDFELEPVPGAEDARFIRASPDGQWLAFLREDEAGAELYKMPIEGGTPKRLTTVGGVHDIAWSPDGRIIAFIAPWEDELTVWFVSAEGGSPVRLQGAHPSAAPLNQLEWFHSGLLYAVPGNSNFILTENLYLQTGEDREPLTAENLGGRWRFVGGKKTVLVEDGRWSFVPRVSPDGQWVAVFWNRHQRGLWKVRVQDSQEVPLLIDRQYRRLWPLGWTEDGEEVLVMSESGVDRKILTVPADGGEPRTLFALPSALRLPDVRIHVGCEPLYTRPQVSWICIDYDQQSDIWLIENFDPDVR